MEQYKGLKILREGGREELRVKQYKRVKDSKVGLVSGDQINSRDGVEHYRRVKGFKGELVKCKKWFQREYHKERLT